MSIVRPDPDVCDVCAMKPRLVRCYRGFASLPGKANIEVFYTVPDFGYGKKLFICIECGELFIIDFENPNVAGKTAEQIAANARCPKCGKRLEETIRAYPESFRADDGRVGYFEPDRIIPPDSESMVKEFLEICI
jgi:DNA-directed RNA polymerase subunit RPC12/RpoP